MLGLFKKRPRKVICECGVHGRPDLIAILYKGDKFYTYMKRPK